MRYQLVLQWSTASGLKDYDSLIEIENLLLQKLDKQYEVDGHDLGSGEMNIFILTNDPAGCFEQTKAILGHRNAWVRIRVGYREISSDEFVILCPNHLMKFDVI